MTNRLKLFAVSRAVDDTGYGSEAAFRSALRDSDSLAPLTETERRWLRDIEAAYWSGVSDGRKNHIAGAGNMVPLDGGGVVLVAAFMLSVLMLAVVVGIVNWLVGW